MFNGLTESTGQSGTLEDDPRDCFCPAMGGPSYKPNYYIASCAERLVKKTCDFGHACSRFIGDEPTRPRYRYVKKGKTDKKRKVAKKRKTKASRVRKCACCGKQKFIACRELCISCSGRLRYHGGLFDYPKSRNNGATVKL